jgi:O-antigen ligase
MVISARRKVGLVAWILLLSCTTLTVWYLVPTPASSFDRLLETARSRFDFERSATGELSPFMEDDRRRGAVIRNLETRVWLWGQTIRYLREHPHVLLTGIGMDRQRFLEEVIGLPYEGKLTHFHTAHNLFLDMLTKAGIGALLTLLRFCGWVLWTALKSVRQYASSANVTAVVGLGCVLVILWPPLLLANLTGEELFTDTVQLHWTIFLGLLLGYLAAFPDRRPDAQSGPQHLNSHVHMTDRGASQRQ